jgi:fused signal recognition particle receptor
MALFGFLKREEKEKLDKGLEKTRTGFMGKIGKALVGKTKVDEAFLDDLEEILISSDVGLDTTIKIIDQLEKRAAKDKFLNEGELQTLLKEEVSKLFNGSSEFPFSNNFEKPHVILVIGVNGVGKTTTIGKLAARFKGEGKKVILGAADTFRAAAVEQLKQWGKRVEVPVVDHGMGTDPGSVAYDSVKKGMEENCDVVIIDTAGRLHNKVNLMNELTKIKRVVQKFRDDTPHEVLLVLDGSTGQNALLQAKEFLDATQVTGIVITKLDGTAKGGVVIGISDQLKIPIRYIGVGEGVEDLQEFDAESFVESLFKR